LFVAASRRQEQSDFEVTVKLETQQSVTIRVDSLTTVSEAAVSVAVQLGLVGSAASAFSVVTPCTEPPIVMQRLSIGFRWLTAGGCRAG